MKKLLLTTAILACACAAFPQGSVNFNNRVAGSGTGAGAPYFAPIYGVSTTSPGIQMRGQASIGVPAGPVVYDAPLLAGTGFTVQIWGGPVGTAESALQLCINGTTTFRTGGGAGILSALADAAQVPGVPGGAGTRAALQLRAWDNQGGTITSWAMVLANPGVPHGTSAVFTPPFDLSDGASITPPGLIGLQSFNLVPEPSVIALGTLGLGALLRRLRKSN